MTTFVAALDGGGTKTVAAFASPEGVVGLTTLAAGCNPQDNPDWRLGLSATLAQLPAVTSIVLGLPGFGEIAALDQLMQAFVQPLITPALARKQLICMNDVELAFRGAFPDRRGILVLAGTGSMAMAQGPQGLVRAGGWGDLFGDEGSAFWIGRLGLQMASQMRDGRIADTGFADRLAEKLKIPLSDGFFGFSSWAVNNPHPRSGIAEVAMYINELSVDSDVTACAVLDLAAVELANHVHTVARLAQLSGPFCWTHSGSVFRSPYILAKVTQLLGCPPVNPAFDALGGGLWLAAQAAGWHVDAAWAAKIRAGLGQKTTV